MSLAKLAPATVLIAVALGACGTGTKPVAGTIAPGAQSAGRASIDDPRTNSPDRVKCLKAHHLQVVKVGRTGLQIGTAPGSPQVVFTPTAGVAQGDVMQGYRWAQGAEVIGAALVYPHQAADSELKTIEACIAQGVAG